MNRKLYTADHARRVTPGTPYRPSNGTEGEMFMERWCGDCVRDADPENPCAIPGLMMLFEKAEPDYPGEIVHDADGQPCCTAHAIEAPAPPRPRDAPGQAMLFAEAPDGSEVPR